MRNDRSRLDATNADVDRGPDQSGDGSAAVLAVTFAETTYPTTAGQEYACHPVTLGGTEAEGDTPDFLADPDQIIYAYNLGTAIPDAGTYVVAHSCGGRWVFRHD